MTGTVAVSTFLWKEAFVLAPPEGLRALLERIRGLKMTA